jgi:monovalent cation/hydrogen antiporter
VVLGTLVVQGLTLGPLLRWLDLHDDNLVGREVDAARDRALQAALATFHGDMSESARAVRQELTAHLRRTAGEPGDPTQAGVEHDKLHRPALAAARQVVFDMRANDEIGDDAFHLLEEELDWMEMGSGG